MEGEGKSVTSVFGMLTVVYTWRKGKGENFGLAMEGKYREFYLCD